MICPKCGHEFKPADAARILGRLGGASTSERKAAASRANGLKGGRPKHLRGGRPRKA